MHLKYIFSWRITNNGPLPILVTLSFILMGTFGCKKLVEVDAPITGLTNANVYTNNNTAAAVLTGIYASMSRPTLSSGGITSMSLYPSLLTDELKLFSGSSNVAMIAYYKNSLSSSNTGSTDFWRTAYPTIYVANAAIEGLTRSESLTPVIKDQLLGEAKFIRAFNYFYLTNLYGDVSLALETDFTKNSTLPRVSKDLVYKQIINDLISAEALLSDKFLHEDGFTPYPSGAEERIRPTKWAALAMLARTYLYLGDWAKAEQAASGVINNVALFDTVSLNSVFLKNSKESIWQLQPVAIGFNTQDARLFRLPSSGPSNSFPVYLNNDLVSAFDNSDLRRTTWIGSVSPASGTFYYPNKYKISAQNSAIKSPFDMTEYLGVLRIAEMYLIRAEARAQMDNLIGAENDLNVIRKRARVANTLANSKNDLLDAIMQERRFEFFAEWGHRWLDLKRSGRADVIMPLVTQQKGGTWETTDKLYPISSIELQRNPFLTQNPGYQ